MTNQSTLSCQSGISLQTLPQSYNLAIICLLIITAITSGCTNCLVILSIGKTPSLHTPSYILLMSLALADFLSGIVGELLQASNLILIAIEMRKGNGPWTSYACTLLIVTKAISYLLCGISISTLVAMSVDRLLAILLKTRYKNNKMVTKGFKAYLVVCWVCLVCFCVSGSIDFDEQNQKRVFLAIFIFVALVVSAIVICYSFAYRILRRSAASMVSHNPNEDNLNLAKHRKVLNTFVIVCVFLLTCYTPFLIATLFVALYGLEERSERTFKLTISLWITELIMYFSATLNPLLYSWRMRDLRKAMKTVIFTRILRGRCTSIINSNNKVCVPHLQSSIRLQEI